MSMSLKAARVDVGLTQQDLADMVNVNKKTIISWENGRSFPDADKIGLICKAVGRNYDEIRWRP